MKPYPYQQERIEAGVRSIRAGKSCSVVLPTGTGKTRLGLWICKEITEHPKARAHSALWLADKVPLVSQTAATAAEMGAAVEVRTIQSLRSVRFDEYDLIVLDEAHSFLTPGRLKKILAAGTPLLGLTATPRRGDGKHIHDLFKDEPLCGPYSLGQAILDGYLVDCRLKAVDLFEVSDLAGVRTTGDDLDGEALASVLNTPTHNAKVAEEWYKHARRADGRLMVSAWFCCTCDHADEVAKSVNALLEREGAPERVVVIHSRIGETARAERGLEVADPLQVLGDFTAGKYIGAVSVGMVAEGFDFPPLQCGMLLRPTKSDRLLVQTLGRILRLHPSKDHALFLDATSSLEGLDLATIYDVLDPKPKRPGLVLTNGGEKELDEWDEGIPMLSDVVARIRDVDLFRRAQVKARTLPWVPVVDCWAVAVDGERLVVIRTSKRYRDRVAAAVLSYDGAKVAWETLFDGEFEDAAFRRVEIDIHRRGIAVVERSRKDIERSVKQWFRDRLPPSDRCREKFVEFGYQSSSVPPTHGEARAMMRRIFAAGRQDG